MKFVKSDEWIRLRGQIPLNSKSGCKIDTAISGEERVFFVPETEAEKSFFEMDKIYILTGMPYGPASHDPDGDWGWRLTANVIESDMEAFASGIEKAARTLYADGMSTELPADANKKDKLMN